MRRLPSLLALGLGSAVVAAPARGEVLIHEIRYAGPTGAGAEYVELFNAGEAGVSLDGWVLLDDDDAHLPCPLSGTLPPGGFLVVAGVLAELQAQYPGAGPLNPTPFTGTGGLGWALGNAGDTVRLYDAGGTLADAVTYDDEPPWPPEPDGTGPSLELISPALDNALASSWAASVDPEGNGTPGAPNSVFEENLAPSLGPLERDPPLPGPADAVAIRVAASDDGALASVELLVDDGGGFVAAAMADDGVAPDLAAGDGVYSAAIAPRPDVTLVRYFVRATDDLAKQATLPDGAPVASFGYTVGHVPPYLVIDEIVASNQNGIADELGERDDWLEIRNRDVVAVPLGGTFLTDDPLDPTRWALPAITIGPGERVVLWMDGEPHQGPYHASFRLGRDGGTVSLYDSVEHGNTRIDALLWGPQNPDVAWGGIPDDAAMSEYVIPPSPAGPASGVPYSAVCVNELLAGSEVGIPDWIELYNRGVFAVDLGGWGLSDDPGDPMKYVFPSPTVLAPGARLVIDEGTFGFGLRQDGTESVLLTDADGVTARDWYELGPQVPDVSDGRFPDGTANRQRFSAWTWGAPNACGPGPAPLAAATGLRFDTREILRWDAVAGAEGYDVLRGDLDAVRAAGGTFSASGAACASNDSARPAFHDASVPAGAWYYLVRGADTACRYGPLGTAATPRAGIESVCP